MESADIYCTVHIRDDEEMDSTNTKEKTRADENLQKWKQIGYRER